MLKLNPLHFDKIWGYEDWIASTHEDGFQKDFFDSLGKDYPLLVKIIQANSSLSVQVHPDDQKAEELEGKGKRGKTECWYVLEASPDSEIIYGLKKNYTAKELSDAIQNGSLEAQLNFVKVKKGDFIFIPAGTVHAIGGGLRLLEVQQSCNITYRMYDWNRGRELHIKKSLASIKNDSLLEIQPFGTEFSCAYFNLKKTSSPSNTSSETRLLFALDTDGNASLASNGKNFKINKEDIFFIKPHEEIMLKNNAVFMEISATS